MRFINKTLSVLFDHSVHTHCVDGGHDGEAGKDEAESEESAHAALGQLVLVEHLEEGDVEQGAAGHALKDADDKRLDACDRQTEAGRQVERHDLKKERKEIRSYPRPG